MDRYTLDWCDRYLDELLDKMGSDLFPLPIKLNRFITITLDFIRETTKSLEVTQEVSDDIKPLLIRSNYTIIQDPINQNLWTCPEPADYIRLVSLVPLFLDSVDNHLKQKAKKVKILKEGQREAYKRDPFNNATNEYPQVFRYANLFKIDVGDATINYSKALLSYIKKPNFADENDLTVRIVNLPDITIEQLLLKTADALRFSTGDSDAVANYQFGQSFGKKGK
jgi:hypothetical protein